MKVWLFVDTKTSLICTNFCVLRLTQRRTHLIRGAFNIFSVKLIRSMDVLSFPCLFALMYCSNLVVIIENMMLLMNKKMNQKISK